jgi:hypothetical protein
MRDSAIEYDPSVTSSDMRSVSARCQPSTDDPSVTSSDMQSVSARLR